PDLVALSVTRITLRRSVASITNTVVAFGRRWFFALTAHATMLDTRRFATPGIMEWNSSMTRESLASDLKQKRLMMASLVLASFLLYANTLPNGFVSDDHQQIEGNPYAHSFRYVGKIFTTTVWSFQGNEGRTNYYRPLMTLGYVLCDKIFQTYPFGFHLVNLFLDCL